MADLTSDELQEELIISKMQLAKARTDHEEQAQRARRAEAQMANTSARLRSAQQRLKELDRLPGWVKRFISNPADGSSSPQSPLTPKPAWQSKLVGLGRSDSPASSMASSFGGRGFSFDEPSSYGSRLTARLDEDGTSAMAKREDSLARAGFGRRWGGARAVLRRACRRGALLRTIGDSELR